jgi:hypothetical protein
LPVAAARSLARRTVPALLGVVHGGGTVKSEAIEIPPAPRTEH